MREELQNIILHNKERTIIPFKNLYKGQDIYVIGSGKSLDFISNDFFNNKITIGINHTYKKLNTTFLLRKDNKILDQVLTNNIDTVHIISKGNCGSSENTLMKDFIIKSNYKNVFYFDHLHNKHTEINWPNEDQLIVSWSTITSGMHFAAYLGAENIILVGHDCGQLDGKSNIDNYHNSKTIAQPSQNSYDDWLKKIEDQTIKVKKYLNEKYKCNIYSLNPFINFGLEGHLYTK